MAWAPFGEQQLHSVAFIRWNYELVNHSLMQKRVNRTPVKLESTHDLHPLQHFRLGLEAHRCASLSRTLSPDAALIQLHNTGV